MLGGTVFLFKYAKISYLKWYQIIRMDRSPTKGMCINSINL